MAKGFTDPLSFIDRMIMEFIPWKHLMNRRREVLKGLDGIAIKKGGILASAPGGGYRNRTDDLLNAIQTL